MKGPALSILAALVVGLSPVAAELAHARDHGDKGSQQHGRRGEGQPQQRNGGGDWDRGQRGQGQRYEAPRQDRGRYEDEGRRRGQDRYEGYRPPGDRYEEPRRGRDRYEEEGARRNDRYERPPSGYPAAPYATPRRNSVRPGGYLGPEYRGGTVYDYQRYRLRPPPRGFSWVRVGDGFALVSPNGQVFDVIQ